MTGDLYVNSANLALKHIEDAGGMRGDYALTLLRADTETKAASASSAIETMLKDAPKAAVVVTSAEAVATDGSGGFIGAGPTAAAAKLPLLCIGCAAPDFDCVGLHQVALGAVASGGDGTCADPDAGSIEISGYLYRTVESSAAQGAELATMALEDGKTQHAGVAVNLPFGTRLTSEYAATVTAAGANYVRTATHEQSVAALARATASPLVTSVAYQESVEKSYTDAVADGAIDALVVNTFPDYAKLIAAAFQKSDKRPALYFSFTAFSNDVLASTNALLGAKGVNYATARGPSPGTFIVDYAVIGNVAEDQIRNSLYVDGAYDAVMLVALAIYATGEENPSSEAVKAKLDTLNDPSGERIGYKQFGKAKEILDAGGAINYDGVSGELDWSLNKLNAVKSPLRRWQVVADGDNLSFTTL